MKPEKQRNDVLEMMLKDGFIKTQVVTEYIDEYSKGNQRLQYDKQRDLIVHSYSVLEVRRNESVPKQMS